MDVDKRYPVITLVDKFGGICEVDLDLTEAKGAVWVGEILVRSTTNGISDGRC